MFSWIPWECLAGDDGVEPEPYDEKAVIWTLATMMWSMFHKGSIPLENENSYEIRNREYRKNFTFDIIDDLLPDGILELLKSCWMDRSKRPTTRDVLRAIKKLEKNV
ncbi:hypothetical protein DICVIV_01315 [Dictyocaulus viviparus]|uniref:Serine-threonine/tyrosine-protein kinase catalytic domain-containing protein n=1 Tax=Dictyocaulus viviparus TaxID=29172 RepID=A0A0D8Y6W4_DICVI|nr:hypothetical protein DICVIV_01315 [Dictyocaulus viviparus]